MLAVAILAGIAAIVLTSGTDKEPDEEVQSQQTSAADVADSGATALPEFQDGGTDPAVGQVIPTVSGDTLER